MNFIFSQLVGGCKSSIKVIDWLIDQSVEWLIDSLIGWYKSFENPLLQNRIFHLDRFHLDRVQIE